jgi:hypothetical protein
MPIPGAPLRSTPGFNPVAPSALGSAAFSNAQSSQLPGRARMSGGDKISAVLAYLFPHDAIALNVLEDEAAPLFPSMRICLSFVFNFIAKASGCDKGYNQSGE